MSSGYALTFRIVSVLAALLMLNEFALRFVVPTGFLNWIAEPGIIDAQQALFSRWWMLFWLFAGSAAAVAVIGKRLVIDSFSLRRPEKSALYVGLSLICAWSGLVLGVVSGESISGGVTARYYWVAIALLWTLSLGLHSWYLRKPGRRVWRDWLLYSHAFALGTPVGLMLLPVFPLVLDFDPAESWISALTSGPAITLLVAHALIFEVLERKRPTSIQSDKP